MFVLVVVDPDDGGAGRDGDFVLFVHGVADVYSDVVAAACSGRGGGGGDGDLWDAVGQLAHVGDDLPDFVVGENALPTGHAGMGQAILDEPEEGAVGFALGAGGGEVGGTGVHVRAESSCGLTVLTVANEAAGVVIFLCGGEHFVADGHGVGERLRLAGDEKDFA